MNSIVKFFVVFLILLPIACKNKQTKVSIIEETSVDLQMIDAYKEGLKELETGDALFAVKKFNEAELLYPQSLWAPRASLMSTYSYYSQNYYLETIRELERYFKTYPKHNRKDYAYYLLAMSHYNQIIDETKDLGPIEEAKKYFQIVVSEYPNTEYAADSEFKLEAIEEILAAKEMYLAKYYIEREKWIPAINRYKNIIDKYQTTIFIEEALHRLVEIHYRIGLIEESKKYANLLGYNYQSGQWYEQSYKIFNKNYKKVSKSKKRKSKNLTLEKIKSLLK